MMIAHKNREVKKRILAGIIEWFHEQVRAESRGKISCSGGTDVSLRL